MPFASTGDCKQWLPNGCLSLDMRVKQKSANFLVKPEVHTHDRLSLHAASQLCDKPLIENLLTWSRRFQSTSP